MEKRYKLAVIRTICTGKVNQRVLVNLTECISALVSSAHRGCFKITETTRARHGLQGTLNTAGAEGRAGGAND